MRIAQWMSTPGLGALLALLLSACSDGPIASVPGDTGSPDTAPDAGCVSPSTPCGENCCLPSEQCHEGACVTCVPDCAGKRCGPDGCGGDCGECTGTYEQCDESGQCVCVGERDDDLCGLADAECGAGEYVDRCGAPRPFDCGDCLEGERCNAALLCECDPGSAAELCARDGKVCGAYTTEDNCGEPIEIPDCSAGLSPCPSNKHCRDNLCKDPAPPENDYCNGATSLGVINGAKEVDDIDLSLADDDALGSCAAEVPGMRDAVYIFSLDTTSALRIELVNAGEQQALNAIYLRRTCASIATELACALAPNTVSPAVLELPAIGPGTFSLWIDTTGESADRVWRRSLSITATPLARGVPANDRCNLEDEHGTAETLVMNAGVAYVEGDTTMGSDDISSCAYNQLSGKDLFYSFTISPQEAPRDIVATAVPMSGSPIIPSLSLRNSCEAGTPWMRCTVAPVKSGATPKAVLTHYGLPAGTYYLSVDTASRDPGPFSLRVELTPGGEQPINDACGDAARLTIPAGETSLSVTGTTVGAADDWNAPCYPFTSMVEDVVYELEVTETSSLLAFARFLDDPEFSPLLYLMKGSCEEPLDYLCGEVLGDYDAEDHTSNKVGELLIKTVEPGLWYLVVDGETAISGKFKLDLYLTPEVTNDTCESAHLLDFSQGNTVRLATNTQWATNDVLPLGYREGGCKTSELDSDSGRDVVWKIEVGANQVKTLRVTASHLTYWNPYTFQPFVFVRSDCSAKSSEISCKMGKAADPLAPYTLSVSKLDGGPTGATWYLWVEGTHAYDGPFDLTVTLEEALIAENDSCAQALPLHEEATGYFYSSTGDNAQGYRRTEPRCAPSSTGGDLVYHLPIAQRSDVTISVLHDDSLMEPIFYVRTSCDPSAKDLACVTGTQGAAAVEVRNVNTDLYIFVTSTLRRTEGKFFVNATVVGSILPPANDLCEGQRLDLDPFSHHLFIPSASTKGAAADYSGSCAKTATDQGGDLVYWVNISAPSKLTASVRRLSTTGAWQPSVYIRKATCGDESAAAEVACGVNNNGFTTASAEVEPATYYIIVDGMSPSPGDFALDLWALPSGALPDTCTTKHPIPIDAGIAGEVRITGDTSLADNTTTSASLASLDERVGNGPDLVYYFTLTDEARLTAKLAFLAPMGDALLYLRRDCSAVGASEEIAAALSGRGGPATLTTDLEPGTYYLWVDSTIPLRGSFDLVLSVEQPEHQPLEQRSCAAAAAAQPLLSEAGTVTLQGTTYGGAHTTTGSCAQAKGPDAIYRVTLPAGATHSLFASVKRIGEGTDFSPVLYVRSDCASEAPGAERACVLESEGEAYLQLPAAQSGTYFIFVDSLGGWGGRYELTVTVGAPAPTSCAAAEQHPLTLEAGDPIVIDGHFDGLTNNATLYCESPFEAQHTGPDLFYRLELGAFTGTRELVINLSVSNPAVNPGLFLGHDECDLSGDNESIWTCNDGAPGAKTMVKRIVSGGSSYWLIVDSSDSTVDGSLTRFGSYQLSIDLLPLGNTPGGGGCDNPILVTLPAAGGLVRLSANSGQGLAHGHTSCKTTDTGRELIYALDLLGPATVEAMVVPAAGSAFMGILELRTSCGSTAASCSTSFGAPQTGDSTYLKANATSEARHFLWVDEYKDGASGPYELWLDVAYPATTRPEDCASIGQPLTFDSQGIALAEGTLTGASDSLSGSCTDLGAPDLVYSFVLAETRALTIELEGNIAMPESTLLLRKGACTSTSASDELGCISGPTPRLALQELPASQYWIVVKGRAATDSGFFRLRVAASEPLARAPNDACGDPGIPTLTFDQHGRSSIIVPAIEAGKNELSGACGPMPGPDLIYRVAAEADMALYVTATALDNSPLATLVPSLYLRTDCAISKANEPCIFNRTEGRPASLSLVPTLASDYYIIVDSRDASTTGGFTLDVALVPAPIPAENDFCKSPLPAFAILDVSTGTAHAAGDISDARDDSTGSCGAMPGPDEVFQLEVLTPSSLVASVAAANFTPALYLRKECDALTELSQFACSTKGRISEGKLSPGTYYLWVDALEPAAAGSFSLEVELQEPIEPATNDTCADPKPLELTGSTPKIVTVTGNLLSATNNYTGDRECSNMPGADLVYSFVIEEGQPRKVTVELTAPGSMAPALYLRQGTCATGTSNGRYGCVMAEIGMAVTMKHAWLDPGVYYLFVDSIDRLAEGTFTLKVTAELPQSATPPTRLSCNDADFGTLTFAGNIATTSKTFDALSTEDTTTGSCHNARGPEFPYLLDLATTRKVTIKVTAVALPGGTAPTPIVYLRRNCASSSLMDERGCIYDPAAVGSARAALVAKALPAGKYALIVDFLQPDAAGTMTLTVTTDNPVAGVPANDTCATAQVLKLDVPYYGTTMNASDVYMLGRSYPGQSACAVKPSGDLIISWLTQGRGPDVVFKYTPTANGPFRISFTPSSFPNTTLWVNKGCESIFDCVTYAYRPSGRFFGSLEVTNAIAGQDYYIFMNPLQDYANYNGPYTIEVHSD